MEYENRGGAEIQDSKERTEIRNSRDRAEIQGSKERTKIRNGRDRAEIQSSNDGAELRNSEENSGTGAQLPKQTILHLIQEATEAMGKAYVPYSHFRVGAALRKRREDLPGMQHRKRSLYPYQLRGAHRFF